MYNRKFKKAMLLLLLIAASVNFFGLAQEMTALAVNYDVWIHFEDIPVNPDGSTAMWLVGYDTALGSPTNGGVVLNRSHRVTVTDDNYTSFAFQITQLVVPIDQVTVYCKIGDNVRMQLSRSKVPGGLDTNLDCSNWYYETPSFNRNSGALVISFMVKSKIVLIPPPNPDSGAFEIEYLTSGKLNEVGYGETIQFTLTRRAPTEGTRNQPRSVPQVTDSAGNVLPFTADIGGTDAVYTYTVRNLTANRTFTIAVQRKYAIFLPSEPEMYTLAEWQSMPTIVELDSPQFVDPGEIFEFTLLQNELYASNIELPGLEVIGGGTAAERGEIRKESYQGTAGTWHCQISQNANWSGGIFRDYTLAISTAQWAVQQHLVRIVPLLQEKYTIDPPTGQQLVNHSGTFQFTIKPTALYAGNQAPRVYSADTTYTAVPLSDGTGWSFSVTGVTKAFDITVDSSAWVQDIYGTADTAVITMSLGEGVTMNPPSFTGTTLDGRFYVKKGTTFNFQLFVDSAYDPNTLMVTVGNTPIFSDEQGMYTLPNVTLDRTITATVRKYGATVPPDTSPTSTGSGNGSGSSASPYPNDANELKYREVVDSKTGVTVAGFFVGIPRLIITELPINSPIYQRFLTGMGVKQENVLRAVDIEVRDAIGYGMLTVGIDIGVGYNTISVTVLHGVNGGIEQYRVYGKDGMANVSVRSFSPFMVVDQDGLGPGASTDYGDNSNGTGNTVIVGPPRTGGTKNTFGFILLGVVFACVIFIIWYRRTGAKTEE